MTLFALICFVLAFYYGPFPILLALYYVVTGRLGR